MSEQPDWPPAPPGRARVIEGPPPAEFRFAADPPPLRQWADDLRRAIEKRINGRKVRAVGAIAKDVEVCRKHYNWLKQLETELLAGRMPEWLV